MLDRILKESQVPKEVIGCDRNAQVDRPKDAQDTRVSSISSSWKLTGQSSSGWDTRAKASKQANPRGAILVSSAVRVP